MARKKRRAYMGWDYWGRPVPGFGDPRAKLVIVGLAPAAHGGNRTGRVFTGDRSGDFLFSGLFRAGYANQANSTSRDDGLVLRDAYVLAAVRCAPPDNQPLPEEARRCASFFDREIRLLRPRVIFALGAFAWDATWRCLARTNAVESGPRPAFAHGAEWRWPSGTLLGSYHVSQQNTQTGRLTPRMFDAVLARARTLCGGR